MTGDTNHQTSFEKFAGGIINVFDAPAKFFREKIVEPNRKSDNIWYHRTFRRVPTVDQCYTDDYICRYEADEQFKRDRMVDENICLILRNRFIECLRSEYPDTKNCSKLDEDLKVAEANFFAKYGELGVTGKSNDALMRQKHRMAWERRHGPIGTGMKEESLAH